VFALFPCPDVIGSVRLRYFGLRPLIEDNSVRSKATSHGSCGAVKAAIDGKAVPRQISQLYALIRPAIEAAGNNLDAAIKANAKNQASLTATASPVMAALIKEGKLKIVAGYYEMCSGRVTVLA